MTLIFDSHPFQYEIERLFRSFFPPIKIALSREPNDAQGEYCLTSRRADGGKRLLSVRLCAGGRDISRSETVPADTPEKEQERALSVLLYEALRSLTGIAPPWGILTGVRPVKVLASVSDEYAVEKLLVSPEKLALARRISAVQKPLAEGAKPRTFSLYVSIPFCPSRCSYCSFISHSADRAQGLIDEYLGLLARELSATADAARQAGLLLDTVYFGGGTPTVLSAQQLERLFAALECFDMARVREFTVEAGRPDTITREKLLAIKRAGARRISVNPQTMNDSVLAAIGRRHTADRTRAAYALAREVGFECINADLIAGLPTDTPESFRASLDEVVAMRPENITVHTLSLKRAAALFRAEDAQGGGASQMVDYAHAALSAAGYSPYYLYRQKNTADNRENTGYALRGTESIYNMYIMEELQTILAAGAGGSTKLVDGGRIKRIANFKYPYEYIDRFNKVINSKEDIIGFFDE